MNITSPCALYKSHFIFEHADVKEEAINSRAEVKSFDHSKLKHVETEEKVSLPGAGGKFLKTANPNPALQLALKKD